MKTRNIVFILSCITAASFSTSAVLADKLPAVNAEGMKLVESTRMSSVYVAPDANLGSYTHILLEDANVSFKKNWKRDYNRATTNLSSRIDDEDMDRIKEGIATSLRDAFTKELQENGYKLVDQAGEFVLRITPAIVNLDVTAPDIMSDSNNRSYSEYSGEMTLNLELSDTLTNKKIYTSSARQRDMGQGFMQWRTSGSNKAEANRMMRSWARSFRETLDAAKASI